LTRRRNGADSKPTGRFHLPQSGSHQAAQKSTNLRTKKEPADAGSFVV